MIDTPKTSEPTALVFGLRPDLSRPQISTGRVVSNRVSRKAITNSSQEKVMARKKLANRAGQSMGVEHEREHLPVARAEVARGALGVQLVVAHLRIDDREAERQVDHDVADPGGEERLGDAHSIEQDEQAHADDQIADHQRRGDQRAQRRGAGQAEAGETVGREEAEEDRDQGRQDRDRDRVEQAGGQAAVTENGVVPAQ